MTGSGYIFSSVMDAMRVLESFPFFRKTADTFTPFNEYVFGTAPSVDILLVVPFMDVTSM